MRTKYIGNCCKIDSKEIYKLIQLYQTKTGQNPNYLIMSEDTHKFIKTEYEETLGKLLNNPPQNNSGFVSQYQGVDIATCNRLKFGEVECV